MGERTAVVTGVLSLEPGHHHETYEGSQLLWGPGPAASRNVSPRLSPPAGPERAEHRSSSHWSRSLSRDGNRGGDWPAGVAGFPGGRRPGAAMASVHESLYFNPMMTNGVVHANVFGIKDWVTPYKMALLVLLSELGRAGSQLDQLERRRLNRLLLPLLQVGSGTEGRGGGLTCALSRHVVLLIVPRGLTCRCRDCAKPSRSAAPTWPAPCTSGGRRGPLWRSLGGPQLRAAPVKVLLVFSGSWHRQDTRARWCLAPYLWISTSSVCFQCFQTLGSMSWGGSQPTAEDGAGGL